MSSCSRPSSSSVAGHRDPDLALVGELHRIADEVEQELVETSAVGVDDVGNLVRRRWPRRRPAPSLLGGATESSDVVDDAPDSGRARPQTLVVDLELCSVEQVVGHACQLRHLAVQG